MEHWLLEIGRHARHVPTRQVVCSRRVFVHRPSVEPKPRHDVLWRYRVPRAIQVRHAGHGTGGDVQRQDGGGHGTTTRPRRFARRPSVDHRVSQRPRCASDASERRGGRCRRFDICAKRNQRLGARTRRRRGSGVKVARPRG